MVESKVMGKVHVIFDHPSYVISTSIETLVIISSGFQFMILILIVSLSGHCFYLQYIFEMFFCSLEYTVKFAFG